MTRSKTTATDKAAVPRNAAEKAAVLHYLRYKLTQAAAACAYHEAQDPREGEQGRQASLDYWRHVHAGIRWVIAGLGHSGRDAGHGAGGKYS